MRWWLFNFAAGASFLLCLMIAAAWTMSIADPREFKWRGGDWSDRFIVSADGTLAMIDRPHPVPLSAVLDNMRFRRRIEVRYGWLVALTLILPAAWLTRWWERRRALAVGRCAKCGYDLRATPDRCPECGTAPGAAAAGTGEEPAER